MWNFRMQKNRSGVGSALLASLLPAFLLIAVCRAGAQTNPPAPPSRTCGEKSPSPEPATVDASRAVRAEQIRAACVEGRRCVCGRVLKVLPTGLVVESGYPSLLRDDLHGAWLVPGTVTANREPNLVESQQPDSMAVGVVFLTDLPRLRGATIKPYDYVVLHSYPAGQYTYTSVGDIQRTVRRLSGGLETAVNLTLQAEEKTNAGPIAVQSQPPRAAPPAHRGGE
jgi:hypothetical protein